MTQPTEPILIYVDPAIAARDEINLERLAAYYRPRGIIVTTDPAHEGINHVHPKHAHQGAPGVEKRRKEELCPCRACGRELRRIEFPFGVNGRKLWICNECRQRTAAATHKICKGCKTLKPVGRFAKSPASIGGRRQTCNDCRSGS